jgi:hypothetical protein
MNAKHDRCHPAGMPTDNDTVFCPATVDACYFLSASTTYSSAITRCSALGGAPVQWNSAFEQLTVEKYFTVGSLKLGSACLMVHAFGSVHTCTLHSLHFGTCKHPKDPLVPRVFNKGCCQARLDLYVLHNPHMVQAAVQLQATQHGTPWAEGSCAA